MYVFMCVRGGMYVCIMCRRGGFVMRYVDGGTAVFFCFPLRYVSVV